MLFQQDPHANARFWMQIGDTVVKIAALLGGAAWTWMHYVRGRTFKPRLELGISSRLFERRGDRYILSTCKVKNIGLSKCAFKKEGNGCEITGLTVDGKREIGIFDIFSHHGWIEPNEDLHHTLVVPISDEELIAIQVTLRIVSRRIRWICREVIEIADSSPTPRTSAP